MWIQDSWKVEIFDWVNSGDFLGVEKLFEGKEVEEFQGFVAVKIFSCNIDIETTSYSFVESK